MIAYPSHDGYVIIDPDPQNSQDASIWFDKWFSFEASEGIDTLIFEVHNTTPYLWSDYHFVFDVDPGLVDWSATIFQNSSFDGIELAFWAPGWQGNSQTQIFTLNFDDPLNGDFGIRQIVTTVPEPATLLLLGAGLIGFAIARRKF